MILLDRLLYRLDTLRREIAAWWFWFSMPGRKDRRCPGCAGARRVVNSYTERDCEVCHGRGTVPKSSRWSTGY